MNHANAICSLCELKGFKSEGRCKICDIIALSHGRGHDTAERHEGDVLRVASNKNLIVNKTGGIYKVNYQSQLVFSSPCKDRLKQFVENFAE